MLRQLDIEKLSRPLPVVARRLFGDEVVDARFVGDKALVEVHLQNRR